MLGLRMPGSFSRIDAPLIQSNDIQSSDTMEDSLVTIVRSTSAAEKHSFVGKYNLTRVGDAIGGPTPDWLAPGVRSLHQIMSMSQHREFDLHKDTSILSDGQKHTRNSLPSLGLCS